MGKTASQISWPLIGNGHIKKYLAKAVDSGQVAGTYVFSGPDNLGKTTTAIHFSRIMLCRERGKGGAVLPCGRCPACGQFRAGKSGLLSEDSLHADFHLIKKDKEKKNITIEQIRGLIKILSLSSFLNSYKIGVIKHAEALTEEAANALLKTLEEPRPGVIIILVTAAPDRLPRTIMSRAQTLEFKTVSTGDIYDYLAKEKKASRGQALELSRLALGRPALAIKFFEDKDFKNLYLKRLSAFLSFFREDLNSRFKTIEDLLKDAPKGAEQARAAARILEIWQGALRDILLCQYGEKDLVQHYLLMGEVEQAGARLRPLAAVGLLKSVIEGKSFLNANVSPRSVLENVALAV